VEERTPYDWYGNNHSSLLKLLEKKIVTNFSRANLFNANLGGANLRNANMLGTNLGEAILTAANLTGANLECANLENAKLKDVNFSKANLRGAILGGSNKSILEFWTHYIGEDYPFLDLKKNLRGVKLEDAILDKKIKKEILEKLKILEIFEKEECERKQEREQEAKENYISPLDAFEGDIDLYNSHYD
jgi:hypothetical protein